MSDDLKTKALKGWEACKQDIAERDQVISDLQEKIESLERSIEVKDIMIETLQRGN